MEWAVVDWEVNPVAVQFGSVTIRWYGICFLAAILTAIKIMEPLFKRRKRDPDDATSLTIHVVFGVIIGSRLVHCLFYDTEIYLADPMRIFKIWEGGLASHGAFLGSIIGSWMWVRGHVYYFSKWCGRVLPEPVSKLFAFLFGPPIYQAGLSWRQMVDISAPGICVTIIYVRLGNLYNHEIIGRMTELPWGFRFFLAPEGLLNHSADYTGPFYGSPATPFIEVLVLLAISFAAALAIQTFQNKDEESSFGFPVHYALAIFFLLKTAFEFSRIYPPAPAELVLQARHPSQIYEMIMGFFMFGLLYWIAWNRDGKHRDGFRLYLFMLIYFVFRFSLEFFKEYQSDFHRSSESWLTMGQYLSLPFIGIFLPLTLYALRKPVEQQTVEQQTVEQTPVEQQSQDAGAEQKTQPAKKSKKKKK
jgi:phosphatidylglycerol---prolipoprotein diacylglyceryl transferase